MRTRINNITFTPGTRSINTGITDLTVDDIRLFVNESQMKVICSSMQKSNIDSIVSGVVTYKNIFPVLAAGDHITFEIDRGDNVAKEVNATANKNEILTKIENTKPDLSTVAKQGSNPNTSLTSVDEKIDGFYNTFDADIASQLQEIIGDSTTGLTGTTQTEEQVSTLRTLQESISTLASAMNTLLANHVFSNSFGGILASPLTDAAQLLAQRSYITMINNGTVESITSQYAFQNCTALTAIKMSALKTINSMFLFQGCTSLTSISMPLLESLIDTGDNTAGAWDGIKITEIHLPSLKYLRAGGSTYWGGLWRGNTTLKIFDAPLLTEIAGYGLFRNTSVRVVNIPSMITIPASNAVFDGSLDLIDLCIGRNMQANFSLSTWSPTNALSASSSSLVELGETFANNLEKLLYNIREHIAALLPDRTGRSSLTITFSAAVKAAIQADAPTAAAFTNKNWVIA